MEKLHEDAQIKHSDILTEILCGGSEVEYLKRIVKRIEEGEKISLTSFEITVRTEDKANAVVDVMNFSNYGGARFECYSRDYERK